MGIARRAFSLGLLGWLCYPSGALQAKSAQPFLASAAKDRQGRYWFQLLNSKADVQLSVPLAARAHQVVSHPELPFIAVISRRPGNEILIVDYQQGRVVHRLASPPGYHLFGHALFSDDGRYLITTENSIEAGEGRLVIRDRQADYEIVNELPSYGIGPHELRLLPDQKTLVVANGGILTHPSQGRKKLNLDTMKPSLAYVSMDKGELFEQHFLPDHLHQLSIRHLDVNTQGQVVMAMQYQGEAVDTVPLVATHQRGKDIHLLEAPDLTTRAMKHYCGSVCFEGSGRYALVSCPRGNLMTLWDTQTGTYHDQFRFRDGCGVAAAGAGQFLVSNGQGTIARYSIETKKLEPFLSGSGYAWDNHLTRV
ncbi:DUF1513 domain-containing protein [Aestuariirhabdus sp. Z084]|uniref:DUF1513 domain-containing protein n=1 Tax=Aestuariirhabdus haliotis TaxID=2918751 RepID=UPI00201B3BA9|nr:DUF1513 domain-containing protein [Aestuariirhabdus haliotis]MCL6415166.1 DUF1513 domain-containing protein [Aestuariirhabdus haliotis]MCL6420041.1 DUF1513 domain-containing protein [Aestuariirhabdus haliotis]